MSRVLIIGAGGVASVVAHKCCQNPDVFESICIASRTSAKCEALRDKLSGGATEVLAAQVDADQTGQVIDLIKPTNGNGYKCCLAYQDLILWMPVL
jgi:saccharopine dehydrogenase (NAD+, L-lysine-forming)